MNNMNAYQARYAFASDTIKMIESLLNGEDYETFSEETKKELYDAQLAAKDERVYAGSALVNWLLSLLPERIRVPLSDARYVPAIREKMIDFALSLDLSVVPEKK